MYPNICHIYGPLYLNCYGLCIALGVFVFYHLIQRHKNFANLITEDKFRNTMIVSAILAALGGRILWALGNLKGIESIWEIFYFWEPGYSLVGSLLAILIFTPIYLNNFSIKVLPLFDLAAIYAPLLLAIARVGCFFSGCCHGIPTNKIWGIIYTHPEVHVPDELKFIKLHPTQLYSSLSLLIIFLLMYFFFQNKYKRTGQLSAIFLIMFSMERFLVDFYRSDREYLNIDFLKFYSLHQWLSLTLFFIAIFLFIFSSYNLISTKSLKLKRL